MKFYELCKTLVSAKVLFTSDLTGWRSLENLYITTTVLSGCYLQCFCMVPTCLQLPCFSGPIVVVICRFKCIINFLTQKIIKKLWNFFFFLVTMAMKFRNSQITQILNINTNRIFSNSFQGYVKTFEVHIAWKEIQQSIAKYFGLK